MSTRPSLSRKVTPGSEKSRKEALDTGVSLTVDGTVYTVRAGDLSGFDESCLRREVGMSFMGLITALGEDPGVDLVAALVWLSRRANGEQMLKYRTVAEEIGFDVEISNADEAEEEEDSPEA